MRITGILVLLIFTAPAIPLLHSPADAGDTLTRIYARKQLSCGVSDGIIGFSFKEPNGHWSGIDADFCRGLAAAVLEDPAKVDYVPLAAAARFPSLIKPGRSMSSFETPPAQSGAGRQGSERRGLEDTHLSYLHVSYGRGIHANRDSAQPFQKHGHLVRDGFFVWERLAEGQSS